MAASIRKKTKRKLLTVAGQRRGRASGVCAVCPRDRANISVILLDQPTQA
jgi:hypothetical protein